MQSQKEPSEIPSSDNLIFTKVLTAVRSGKDLNQPLNEDHETHLHKAVISKNERAVRILLICGADPNVYANYCDPFTNEYDIVTPLHCAVKLGLTQIVVLLLQYGADPNNYTSMMGYSALHLSVISDCLTTFMAYIFYARKSMNIDSVVLNDNFDGWSSLHLAIYLEKIPVINILIDCGADVGIKNVFGFIPLQLIKNKDVLHAILTHPKFENKEIDLVKYLSDKGVDFGDTSCPNSKSLHQMALDYGFKNFAKCMEEYETLQDHHESHMEFLEQSFESQLQL